MNRNIFICLFLTTVLLSAGDIELVQYSDLRLRNSSEQAHPFFGSWNLKDGAADETIQIDPDKISGSDGCNRFSASLMIAGESLKVGPVMSTRASCEELNGSDEAFRMKLAKVAAYQLTKTGELQLLNGSGEILFSFIR